jgi:peptide/nickel transport system substrate-binding protein
MPLDPQRMRRRHFLRLTLLGTGAVALLGACAAPPAPAPAPPAPAATTAPAPAATAAPAPAATAATAAPASVSRQPELTVGIDSDPITLDTRQSAVTQGYPMIHHITEPLVFRQTDGKVIPWLADSWERQGDLVWKLHLKQGVKFTNGEPFDAESVKYTLDSITDPTIFPKTTAQRRSFLQMIQKVDIVDPSTVTITTKNPSRSMLSYLTTFGTLPAKAARDLGEKFGTQPIGTGPFKMGEYVPGSQLSLDANKDYWGGAPASDKLTFRFIPEAATRVAALQAGEVAMINSLPPDQVDLIKNNPQLDTAEVMSTRILHLHMTVNRAPFQDIRVRQAINYAIDREGIVKALLGGHGMAATKLIYSPSILYASEQPAYEYNQAKAQQLLADAGVTGSTIKYAHTTGRFLNDRQIGQTLGQQLQKIGFTVNLEAPEWGTLFQRILDSQYDIWFAAYGTLTLDPDYAMNWLYNSQTSWNKYSNPKVDQLLQTGDQAFDNASATYADLQSTVWQDVPNNWLYFQPELHGVNKKLRNHQPRPDEYWLFKDVYLEK